ncbi:MAG: hypothetical protein DDT26_01963 [Dehalococcoidia bacterium]|nr:hypothetical protein [Chloroflexota bacterium]
MRDSKKKALDDIEKRVSDIEKGTSAHGGTHINQMPAIESHISVNPDIPDLVTDQQILHYQEKSLKQQLSLVEIHLKEGNRIFGKPCDCAEKHGGTIEALAVETISMNPQKAALYSEIAGFARELQSKGTPEAVASGKYDAEYPKLAARSRQYRKKLFGRAEDAETDD